MRRALGILPPWVARGLLVTFIVHDALFLIAAGFAAYKIPMTIEATLQPYAWIWVGMVGVGAVVGMVGNWTRKVAPEVLGCSLMAAGLVVYSLAIIVSSLNEVDLSLAAAAVFLATASSLGTRIFLMFAAIWLRSGEAQ